MSNKFDKEIEDLTKGFKEELIQAKEECFDEEFVKWYKEQLKGELLWEIEKAQRKKLKEDIKEELKKCKGQDDEISLESKVALVQTLIYEILVMNKYDI